MNKARHARVLVALLIITVFCTFVMPDFSQDMYAYAATQTHLSKSSISVKIGNTQKINLILPSGKKVPSSQVTWKSSASNTASVSSGTIKGLKFGSCTISAKYKGKVYKCRVTVKGTMTFSGNGEDVIKVKIPKGIYKVTAVHSGKSNFIVDGLDASGEDVALLANFIGDGASSKYLNKALSYIEIDSADGSWTIKISTLSRGSTAKIKGQGDTVSSLFYLSKKPYVVKSQAYNGDSNFVVWAVRADGSDESLLANDIGACKERKVFTPRKAGYYFIEVEADQDAKWMVDFGKGDSVTTTNNNIKNLGTPNKPETPSKPEADKPSEDKPSTPGTPTETPSTPEKPPTDKPSSGSSWDIYENNTPEENLEILAEKATRKLSLSRSAKDEVYIKYSAYHPEINFYSTLDSGGLSTSILAVYNTSTQKWAKVQFTIGGTTGAASMITESEFDPSSYTYGKDMNFKFVGDSPVYGFTGATEADINEVANTSFQTLWSGTGVILLRELKMQLKDIGFDQL